MKTYGQNADVFLAEKLTPYKAYILNVYISAIYLTCRRIWYAKLESLHERTYGKSENVCSEYYYIFMIACELIAAYSYISSSLIALRVMYHIGVSDSAEKLLDFHKLI